MVFEPYDSSGTDDDLPPPHQNRAGARGVLTGNGVDGLPHIGEQNDMITQIHQIEQEAYSSVLRAFKAQSDTITWEKESLITELRKELRVSDVEHRELLSRVNSDDTIRRIREWRQTGRLSIAKPAHDRVSSPTVSASRKRKISQCIPSLPLSTPAPSALPSQSVTTPVQPAFSSAKRPATSGANGKKHKTSQTLPGASAMKSVSHTSAGPSARVPATNRSAAGALAPKKPVQSASRDPLIGRKVMTRWPADNNFYEATITDYNSLEGRHLLVYDINTPNETWEWVNLKEISPKDLRWKGEDPGISQRGLQVAQGNGVKKPTGSSGPLHGAGGGRGSLNNHSKKTLQPLQNGIGKKGHVDIKILHTGTLLKEVERAFNASPSEPVDFEKTKKLLRDHEQSLIDAIAILANGSDCESEEGKHMFPHGAKSTEQDQGWKNRHNGANYDGREPSDSDVLIRKRSYRLDEDEDEI